MYNLPSGNTLWANRIVKTIEFPSGKFTSGARTIVRTKHSRWHHIPQNGIFECAEPTEALNVS